MLETFNNDQISDQLVTGYWTESGSVPHDFGFDLNDGVQTLHVDYSALDSWGQSFATQALDIWSAVSGIRFSSDVPAAESVDISFDDTRSGASCSYSYTSSWLGTQTTRTSINFEPGFGNGETGEVDSYSRQAMTHEIGHALGLGHPGNYNYTGTPVEYEDWAKFANDSWSSSIMSYFSQTENTEVSADYAYLLTPTVADIIAIREMYGSSGTLRAGDTVYGNGSTAGDAYDLLEDYWQTMVFTIVDDGGIDTIDFSTASTPQDIDLTPEVLSDTGKLSGNMSIARGTVIENFLAGSGADRIAGNDANNLLCGNGGSDILSGGAGKDRLEGNAGGDRIWGGSGNDRLNGNADRDSLYGGKGRDRLFGGSGADELDGDAGNDKLWGARGADVLSGGDGKDRLDGGSGNDSLTGGAGGDCFVFGMGYGRDTVQDFADDIDTLTLDSNLWNGDLSAQEVLDRFATLRGGDVVLDFGTDELRIDGKIDIQDLVDDLIIA